jgi:hypothetical protein
MWSSCTFCPAATGNIIGSPTFTGGATPTSYARENSASDGADIGIP